MDTNTRSHNDPSADGICHSQNRSAVSRLRRHSVHGYNLHQLQGNPAYGLYKTGYLKKLVGKMNVKSWRKRKCIAEDGTLKIHHSDKSKIPTKLSLLTCQVRPTHGDDKCFDLISFNRTYHFQAESDIEAVSWISVLINNKELALKKVFNRDDVTVDGDDSSMWPTDSTGPITKVRQNKKLSINDKHQTSICIQQSIINHVRLIPGNDRCADCSSTTNDVSWLSTNLGILVCIECSGVHRDLGVHVSRIQSLTLDKIGTSHLLIARGMGNDKFNKVFEAAQSTCDIRKLNSNSSMVQRYEYIRSKYIDKMFINSSSHKDPDIQLEALVNGIVDRDLLLLLQVLAEGVDMVSYLPSTYYKDTDDLRETSLHLAIKSQLNDSTKETNEPLHCGESSTALTIVDFIIQNSRQIDRPNIDGDTPLHYCVRYNLHETAKLLLRSRANIDVKNNLGLSPLELAQSMLPITENVVEILMQSCTSLKGYLGDVNPDWSISNSSLADSSFEYGSSDEENHEDIRKIPKGLNVCNSRSSSMDENDNSTSFSNRCLEEDEVGCQFTTPKKNDDRRKIKQRAFSERKHREFSFKRPIEVEHTDIINKDELDDSFSIYRHFNVNSPVDDGTNHSENAATLDRSASICNSQTLWSQSLTKSKQLSSIFGSSPRGHRFTSSFRNTRSPSAILRKAVTKTVNKERMQKVKQLLRVDSFKQ